MNRLPATILLLAFAYTAAADDFKPEEGYPACSTAKT